MVTEPRKLHVLFVCGRNKWRSPTAVRLYRDDPRLEARSAGVGAQSRHQLSSADVAWADLILVMEPGHAGRIRSGFRNAPLPPIECLDIPDDHEYMDEELVESIQSGVEQYLERFAHGADRDAAAARADVTGAPAADVEHPRRAPRR